MGVKGSQIKQEISEKILKAFPGSFLYNDGKEIRINGTEDGVPVQIKVTLTAAKTMVGDAADVPFDAETEVSDSSTPASPQEPSEDEKARLAMLLNKLGL